MVLCADLVHEAAADKGMLVPMLVQDSQVCVVAVTPSTRVLAWLAPTHTPAEALDLHL